MVPSETYSNCVYGDEMLKYEIRDIASLINTIKKVYLLDQENLKSKSIVEIFEKIKIEKDKS